MAVKTLEHETKVALGAITPNGTAVTDALEVARAADRAFVLRMAHMHSQIHGRINLQLPE